jgi:hypothetical protein
METFIEYKNKDLKDIYFEFLKKYNEDDFLINHRTYIESNGLGFGEKPFHSLWDEIIKLQKNNFKFLEIGVYKGQILSLVKLLSDRYDKSVKYVGVTPLNNSGDKFSNYDNINYSVIIESLFNHFNLKFNLNENIINGSSTSEDIKNKIREYNNFDVIYIDGCHDYDCVVSDILLMKEITKQNSIVVLDDSSCYKEIPENNFKGHIDVCNAIKDYLENDSNFIEILCVGHNRVFKRIK